MLVLITFFDIYGRKVKVLVLFLRTVKLSRRPYLLALAAVAFVVTLLLTPVTGWAGGGGNSNFQAGDCSCHGAVSSAVVSMTASKTILAPGEQVVVTVTVTGGEAENNPLGVMIVSKLSGGNTMPTDYGWVIVSDTWSTQYNYNEITAYKGSAEFVWTLEAPEKPGVYSLYARMENSAKGVAYYKDYSAGMAFTVQDGSSSNDASTFLSILTPVNGTTLSGSVTIDATVAASEAVDITSANLEIDGSVVDSTNGSSYTWTVDTSDLQDGEHKIKVTAITTSGETVSKEVDVTVINQAALIAPIQQFELTLADIGFLTVVGFIFAIGIMELRRKNRWH